MHPLKVWMHKASMIEYFDRIPHLVKRYMRSSAKMPANATIGHPTDAAVVKKYKKATFIDTPGFLLKVDDLSAMDTPVQQVFYKRMRIKLNLLMKGDKPEGGKW